MGFGDGNGGDGDGDGDGDGRMGTVSFSGSPNWANIKLEFLGSDAQRHFQNPRFPPWFLGIPKPLEVPSGSLGGAIHFSGGNSVSRGPQIGH